MKLMLCHIDDFLEKTNDMASGHLRLLFWLGSLHHINGSHLKTTQTALASKYGVSSKHMSNMISTLRKKGFLLTGKEQGVPMLVLNPIYFQFGDLKSYKNQERLWHLLETKTPDFKKQQNEEILEIINS